jgi:hypothetical protein
VECDVTCRLNIINFLRLSLILQLFFVEDGYSRRK